VIRQSATVFKTRRDKSQKRLSQDELDDRLVELIGDYNRWGITGIIDRNCSDEARGQYARLLESERLSIRVRLSLSMTPNVDLTEIEQRLDAIAADPLFKDPDPRLGVIGVKVFEDGGMLTGCSRSPIKMLARRFAIWRLVGRPVIPPAIAQCASMIIRRTWKKLCRLQSAISAIDLSY
jgi:hypothetical protein